MWATGYNNTGELGTGNDYTEGKVTAVLNKCSSVTAVETLSENPEISVYPNPNMGSFHIQLQHVPYDSRVEIYNLVAEKMYDQAIHSNTISLDLENYSKGMYFYKLVDQNHLIASGKIIVN